MKASERAKLLSYRSPQPLNHTYYNIQYNYTTNKLQREDQAHTRLTTTQPLEGIAKHSKTGHQDPARSRKFIESSQRRLKQKKDDLNGLQYWKEQDFSQTPIPTSDEMFGNTEDFESFRERAGMDAHSPSKKYHIFDPAWSEWYDDSNEPNNLTARIKSQTDLLDATYNTYVKERSSSRIVQVWTSGMDDVKNVPPPHKMMEYTLLFKAFGYNATDEQVEIEGRSIRKLYNLVTEAPRCPDMMSFIRVVRNSTRLPQFWFKLKRKKEMQSGDSIVLPVFMSTSNTDLESSWMTQGPDSVASNVDEFDKNKGLGSSEENCCLIQVIVSKGTPMLPLGDFNSNKHQHENEILLPPGIELVLLSEDVAEMNEQQNLTIYTFITRVGGEKVVTE